MREEMTLKELLKEQTLPVRVRDSDWRVDQFFEIHYLHEDQAYGHDQNSESLNIHLCNHHDWSRVELPTPKLLAGRNKKMNENHEVAIGWDEALRRAGVDPDSPPFTPDGSVNWASRIVVGVDLEGSWRMKDGTLIERKKQNE